MVRIRRFETVTSRLYEDGELPGFVHLYIGQEAVAVGSCGALEPDDYITSTHRGHGHGLALGLDPKYMMAELYGRESGYNDGKGGSMHIADVDAGMLGANGIVGAGVPIAAGAGITIDLQGDDRIALSFIGDGATAQGQVHEALNLAAVWDLPLVVLIENNQYAEAAPVETQHNVDQLSDMAAAYDVPGVTVDGTDVTAVHDAVRTARRRAVEDGTPTVIEAETYRYHSHTEGLAFANRSDAEIEEWRARDPIASLQRELVDAGELTDDEVAALEAAAADTMEAAVAFATDAAHPDPETAYKDVFATTVPDVDYHRATLERESP